MHSVIRITLVFLFAHAYAKEWRLSRSSGTWVDKLVSLLFAHTEAPSHASFRRLSQLHADASGAATRGFGWLTSSAPADLQKLAKQSYGSSRRDALRTSFGGLVALLPSSANAETVAIPEPVRPIYIEEPTEEFTRTPSGLLYFDVLPGTGRSRVAEVGDTCVTQYTGYVGKTPFEVGLHYFTFELGSGRAIPAIDEGVRGMAEGAVRQLLVEPELGYPEDDRSHDRVGPKPATGPGQLALNFFLDKVREAPEADKSLRSIFFTIKLLRVDKPGEKVGVDAFLDNVKGKFLPS